MNKRGSIDVTRSRSSSRFELLRRKVFGGANEEERQAARKEPTTPEVPRRRGTVFGLSGAAAPRRRSKGEDELESNGVQFSETSSGSSSPQSASPAPSRAAMASVEAPEGSPATRTRRSLSVANLRDKLAGKNDYRKSVGEAAAAAASGAGPNAAAANPVGGDTPKLRRQISEKFSRDRIAKMGVADSPVMQRARAGSNTPELRVASPTPSPASEPPVPPRFLARPAASIPERDALLSALSSCVVNLTRLLGSSNKAARMLGQEPRSRSSSAAQESSAQAAAAVLASMTQQSGDGGAVLEAAAQLGESIANLTSRLYEPGAAALVRETLARTKRLEDVASHLFERTEDGREWKEVHRRMGNSVLRLLQALEAHVQDPESPVLLLRVRGVLDELQGAGYYLKAFLSGVLIEPGAEQALLCCVQSLFQLGNAAVAKLVAAGAGTGTSIRRLAHVVSELRLSVIVLSPVACCKEPGAQLAVWCGECAAAVDAVLTEVPQARVIAALQRVKLLAEEAQCLVRTAVSAVRLRIQANAGNVVALLALSEAATAALQRSVIRPAEVRPVLAQLSAACDAVRAGLLSGSRVQSSAWAEVHAHQKRVLADAMLCERSARPLLSEDGAMGAAREDMQDAMLVAAIRLSCNIKSFVSLYVASAAASDPLSLSAACELVAAGNARHRTRALLAAVWTAMAAAEAQLRSISTPEAQRLLFGAISKAGAACHEVALALDELEGVREPGAAPSAWQQWSPVAQLAQLSTVWDGPNSRLNDAARELGVAFAADGIPPEVGEALLPHSSNLKSLMTK